MLKFEVLSLLLLGSCCIAFVCSESVASGEKNVEDDAAVTLSTELLPPPLPPAGEHHGIVYLINLFAVRNKSAETPEGREGNVLTDDSPEIIGPLASILLVVEDDDGVDEDGITLDNLAEELIETDYDVEGDSLKKSPEKIEAEDKPRKIKKSRRKRTLFSKCKTCGGGGGGGGYEGGGYNNYPNGGGQQTLGVIPIVLVPVTVDGGGGRRGGHGGGGHRPQGGNGHYPQGGGGGNYYPQGGNNGHGYYPPNGGYQNGGGSPQYPTGGGGGGRGSNSYSQASAQAQSQSSNYGW